MVSKFDSANCTETNLSTFIRFDAVTTHGVDELDTYSRKLQNAALT